MNKKKPIRGMGIYIIVLLVLLIIVSRLLTQTNAPAVTYADVVDYFHNEQVREFTVNDGVLTMKLSDDSVITYELASESIFYNDLGETILQQHEAGILEDYDYQVRTMPWYASFLPYLILIGILVLFWFFMMKRGDGGAPGAMQFGKSKAKIATDANKKVTFRDVAGADEEKAELQEIVEFLKDSAKFTQLGARIPKGVLLVGPPGTGKTLLAKAVAGEAGVPFLSISGSDFVELYVGVGASRVRDLFEQAKKRSPAIIFIDEIDAVGRQRGAGLGGGHDEREQTLNQLLVEMDGFGVNEGVVVIAATNRPDILDKALLRPGRFDRQVYVGAPDVKGREAILQVHARNKQFDPDVDFSKIARSTAGFTGADLENLLNEAALLAARRSKKFITMDEIEEAILKVQMGAEKKTRVISDDEKRLTAYHEAGHAIAFHVLPTQDPVHHVTIIPRSNGAGGFTMPIPTEEKHYYSKTFMQEHIIVCLAGRIAEKLVLGDISTGASNDIKQATSFARLMVTTYGMSDVVGPVDYSSDNDHMVLGRDIAMSKAYSDKTAAQIDSEVHKLISEAYSQCETILTENLDKLRTIAEYLIEHETLDGENFARLFRGEAPVDPNHDAALVAEARAELTAELEAKEKAQHTEEHGISSVQTTPEPIKTEDAGTQPVTPAPQGDIKPPSIPETKDMPEDDGRPS